MQREEPVSLFRRLRRKRGSIITLADNARESGDWSRAVDLYRKALNRNSRNPPIWVQYGHALKETGQPGAAEIAYRTAINYDANAADTHLQLGHVLKLQGKATEAQAAYLMALTLDARLTDCLRELASLGWTEACLSELSQDPRGDTAVASSEPEAPRYLSTVEAQVASVRASVWIERGIVHGQVTDDSAWIRPSAVTLTDQDDEPIGEVASSVISSGPGGTWSFEYPLPARCYGRREFRVRVLVDGRELAWTEGDLRLVGFLDLLSAERCGGWLCAPHAPQTRFDIEVRRNGELVGSGCASLPRPDLRDHYPTEWDIGFDITLSPSSRELDPSVLSVRLMGSQVELFEGPFLVGHRAGFIQTAREVAHLANVGKAELSPLDREILRAALAEFCARHRRSDGDLRLPCVSAPSLPPTRRRLTIIIPIYRGITVTKECVDCIIQWRDPKSDALILVNDCSPETGMVALLNSYLSEQNVFLLANEQNLGFIKSVNRALDFCKQGDVLILNSDTRVFEGGLDELLRVAHGADDIGTVTAISNNATIFSYPHPYLVSGALEDVSWPELARVALRENSGMALDVPTGHGFCLLLKRAVLDRLGGFNEIFGRGYGEENEFCSRAADLGYRHVAAAGAFVEHRESVSFGSEKEALLKTNLSNLAQLFPEYIPTIMDYIKHDNLRQGRWALDAFRLAKACERGGSFALVISTWLGGGSHIAIADLEACVGYGGSQKAALSCTENGQLVLQIENPAVRAIFQPNEVDRLFAVLEHVTIPLVIVHQLLGYRADFIKRLGEFVERRRSVYYVHDFYPVCPRVTMIDAAGEFCNGPDTTVCADCIEQGGRHDADRLGELTPHAHRELLRDFMRRTRHVVTPSRDARDRVNAIFADLAISVIPHPQTGLSFPLEAADGSLNDIIVLGAVGPHKGSATLLEIAQLARLAAPGLTFHVIGYTDIDDALTDVGNVRIAGRYERAQLPELLAAAGGRLALFLHGWPETFSYALAEAVAHGLIPLAPDLGAPAARIRAAKFGHVFAFPIDPGAVLQLILNIASGKVDPTGGNGSPMAFATPLSIKATQTLFFDRHPDNDHGPDRLIADSDRAA